MNELLSRKIAALVVLFLENKNSESVRFISSFEMKVVSLSVKTCKLAIDVNGCLNGKSVNREGLASAYGKEISEKDLFGTLYLERVRQCT